MTSPAQQGNEKFVSVLIPMMRALWLLPVVVLTHATVYTVDDNHSRAEAVVIDMNGINEYCPLCMIWWAEYNQ